MAAFRRLTEYSRRCCQLGKVTAKRTNLDRRSRGHCVVPGPTGANLTPDFSPRPFADDPRGRPPGSGDFDREQCALIAHNTTFHEFLPRRWRVHSRGDVGAASNSLSRAHRGRSSAKEQDKARPQRTKAAPLSLRIFVAGATVQFRCIAAGGAKNARGEQCDRAARPPARIARPRSPR